MAKREAAPPDSSSTRHQRAEELRQKLLADVQVASQVGEEGPAIVRPMGYVSTRCPMIDFLIGRPGIPLGGITAIIGAYGTGKTTLCYQIVAETQALGGQVVYFDCVTPETPVLRGDLNWVPAGTLLTGDTVVAFDEQRQKYGRRFRTAQVTNHGRKLAPLYEIVLATGERLRCTGNHQWLVLGGDRRLPHRGQLRWVNTETLHKTLQRKSSRPVYRIPRYCSVWKEPTSYQEGFLAGAFDADGSLHARRTDKRVQGGISFSQLEGAFLQKVRQTLTGLQFDFGELTNTSPGKLGTRPTQQMWLRGGFREELRFLGQVRPIRLRQKWQEQDRLDNHQLQTKESVEIVEINQLGLGDVVMLESSTKTYLARGFPAHNTEGRFNFSRAKQIGVDPDDFILVQPETLEETYQALRKTLETARNVVGPEDSVVVFVDSAAGAALKADLEGEDSAVGSYSRLLSKEMKTLPGLVHRRRIGLVITGQPRQKIEFGKWGKPDVTWMGERAIGHAASTLLLMEKQQKLGPDPNSPIGHRILVTNKDTRIAGVAREDWRRTIDFYSDTGFDYWGSIADLLTDPAVKLLNYDNGWYRWKDNKTFRRKDIADRMEQWPDLEEALARVLEGNPLEEEAPSED